MRTRLVTSESLGSSDVSTRRQEVLKEAEEWVAEVAPQLARDSLAQFLLMFQPRTESPLEELFLIGFGVHIVTEGDRWLTLQVNEPVGKYRPDFIVTAQVCDAEILFVVELDGHDFHEKTKHQVEADKIRERFLISKGYTVIRFAGSEVWRDPMECAYEVLDQIIEAANRRHKLVAHV